MHPAPQPADFRGLWNQHHGYVWAVLRRLGVPERDAEDLLQDVFVVVHRRWSDFEGRSSMTTWLYGIATRVYWNYARRERARPPVSETSATLPSPDDPSTCPQRSFERQQAGVMLERLLGELDPPKRTAYVLSELEGLTAPQISAITGVKQRTIYSRIRAAKAQIEASAQRVRAREAGDVVVRRLARESTQDPPADLRRRAWASLLARIPESSAPMLPAVPTVPMLPTLPMLPMPRWMGWGLAAIPAGVGVVALGATLMSKPSRAPRHAIDVAEAQVDAKQIVESRQLAAQPPPAPPSHPPVMPAPSSVRPATVPASPSPRPTSEPQADQSASELELLRTARVALRADDPARALSALRKHARQFPHSALTHERDKTRLVALCGVGEVDEAKAQAESLGMSLPAACSL